MKKNNLTKNKIQKISAPIEGMTCASCVARVEKSINKIDGVNNVSVNLATEKATFEIDDFVSLAKIEKAVEEAGYKIILDQHKTDWSKVKVTNQSDTIKQYDKKLKHDFIISIIFTIPIFLISMGMMWTDFHHLFPLQNETANKILLVLTMPVVFISGNRFYKIFFNNLKHLTADMNSLVAIGTGSAFVYSTLITLFPEIFSGSLLSSHTYFETTAVIITLILMGRWLENRAKSKTGLAIKKLVELKPQMVTLKKNDIEKEIPIKELQPGDIVVIKPGGKIPADGKIIRGNSAIDESMITGEPMPVEKNVGAKVIGGTINKTGSFEFEVTAVGDNSILGQIIRMVEEAQGSKAPIQKLADKIAAVFVPLIILIAFITFLGWLIFGSVGLSSAMLNFVAVLIIACPCALGLATPTAIIVGTGKGAQQGILIKNAESLELAHKLDTIIFDKTGTITSGKPEVTSVHSYLIDEKELIAFAIALEQKSEHPIAEAIVSYGKERGVKTEVVENFESLTGAGLKGKVGGNEILIGNKLLMEDYLINIEAFESVIAELSAGGKTIIFIVINKELKGIIALEDRIKTESATAIKKLKSMNLKTVLLTGDNHQVAKKIADMTGFNEYKAELVPEDKLKIVSEYQKSGRIVAMVGDGINDAPALAQSDVGIAMGTGTDVAIESGDIVLMTGDLNGVTKAINLSRLTLKTIKQNLFWAFIYNVIGVPMAALGLLNPMIAALAMSFSSVSVVTNSLRLKKKKL